jgi:hypothetical protein
LLVNIIGISLRLTNGNEMKKIIYMSFLLLIIIIGCNESDNEYKDNGTIVGIDIRECSCCGGYFIEIRDSVYRFNTLPAGSELNLIDPKFPIYVMLDWKMKDTLCLGDEIIVLKIKPR